MMKENKTSFNLTSSIQQCGKLTVIQLLNYFGFNEARYSKDKKKRNQLLLTAFALAITGLLMAFYIGIMAYSMVYIGATEIIPSYMMAITSIAILFFTIFKAGSIIFQDNHYEILIAMPIQPAVIVTSKFLYMYLSNIVLSIITLLPGCIVYANFAQTNLSFYIMIALSIPILPLIPMSIASAISTLIAILTSRLKYKNFLTIILSMSFFIAIMALSFNLNQIKMTDIANIAQTLTLQINHIYPLTPLYTLAITEGNWWAFSLFVILSVIFFIALIALAAWKFSAISSSFASHATKRNYIITDLPAKSPLQALYIKEIKRYFSSNIYVMNTLIGYILMLALSLSIFIMGIDKIEQILGLSGLISSFIPLILSGMAVLAPSTTSSISLEGKQWWIPLSMPISSSLLFNSKILVNLTFALPASIISAILIAISIPLDIWSYVWLFLTPIVYSLFSSVAGITINIKMPVFHWNNEAEAVKQSAATFTGMMLGFASIIIPLMLILFLKNISHNIIMGLTTLFLTALTILLYLRNNKVDLRKIGQ